MSSQNFIAVVAFAALVAAALFAAGPDNVMTGLVVGNELSFAGSQINENLDTYVDVYSDLSDLWGTTLVYCPGTDKTEFKVCAQTGVTKKWVYIKGVGTGQPYLMEQISNPSCQCYNTLDVTDAGIVNLKQVVPGLTVPLLTTWVATKTPKTLPKTQVVVSSSSSVEQAPVRPAVVDSTRSVDSSCPSGGPRPCPNAEVSTTGSASSSSPVGPSSVSASSASPSAVSTSGMTLYNLNKWPVGFANPDAEEKPFKDFIEEQVKGKHIAVENGLPPKDGVTIDASYPDSAISYSLLKLSGTTLSAQTYCQSQATLPTDASSTAGSTPPASCEEQQKYTQELLAYVLDEGRDSVDFLKNCKLTQIDDKQASAICGGTKPNAAGLPLAPTEASGVLTGASQPSPELTAQAGRQGLDLTCIGQIKVDVKPGSFDGKGGKIDLSIKLKDVPGTTPPAATGASTSGSSGSAPDSSTAKPAPAVFFSISLQPVQLKERGNPAKFDDWQPAWPVALWSKYCINAGEGKKNFGATDNGKDCNDVAPESPIYKALQAALKAEASLSLDLEKDLKIKVAGMKGKVPSYAAKKKEEKPVDPKAEPASEDATSAVVAPFSSIDYGEQVASVLLFAPAPAAASTTAASSAFNYYKFTSSDAASNPNPKLRAFNVGFGQAVAVKVFVHQWFNRTPTRDSQPAAGTNPPKTTPEKVYCSTPLGKDLKDLGARPDKPFDVKGLEEFKKVETKPVKVPAREDSSTGTPGPSSGGAPSGGGQSTGGGAPVASGTAPYCEQRALGKCLSNCPAANRVAPGACGTGTYDRGTYCCKVQLPPPNPPKAVACETLTGNPWACRSRSDCALGYTYDCSCSANDGRVISTSTSVSIASCTAKEEYALGVKISHCSATIRTSWCMSA